MASTVTPSPSSCWCLWCLLGRALAMGLSGFGAHSTTCKWREYSRLNGGSKEDTSTSQSRNLWMSLYLWKGCVLTWLRLLRGGDHSGLSGWTLNPMTSVFLRVRKRLDTDRRGEGRNWSDVASSQGMRRPPDAGRSKTENLPQSVMEEAWPCQHLGFRRLSSRTVREQISAVL